MKRAAIYARVSSERQAADDRVSIGSQLSDCEAYCGQHGYRIVARFVDSEKYRSKGKLVQPSGERKDRPQYSAMLAAARRGEFDVIIAWKEDRLYRGMYAAMPLCEILDELGKSLDIELVRETFDRKMLGIKAALGKIEVDNIRERMIMGRRGKLERGEVPGGDQVKYGYRREDRRLHLEETEAQIVRLVFRMYINGESIQTMRKRLDASGVPPRSGGLWSKATIQRIVSGDFYATGRLTTSLEDQHFVIECPVIISAETWQKVQEVKQRNREYSRPRYVKEDYLCAGLVYCGCGWKLQSRTNGHSRHSRNRGKDYRLAGDYVCQRPTTQPEKRPDNCAWSTGSMKVDEYVWNYVKRICTQPALVRTALARKLAVLAVEQESQEHEIERLEKALEKLLLERQWVITQARRGGITEGDMDIQLGALQVQQCSHERELNDLKTAVVARQQVEAAQEYVTRYLDGLSVGLDVLDVELDTVTDEQLVPLTQEFEAWRFAEKFPGDVRKQAAWAILEEKRRIVRTLISKVIIERTVDGGRLITPVLSIGVPVESLASGDQSLEYVERRVWEEEQPAPPLEG